MSERSVDSRLRGNDIIVVGVQGLIGDGINFSFYSYLLSAIQKDHVVRLLLPYVHIIMDRYVYSVIAHYHTHGAKTESVNLDSFPITRPDFFFLLIAEEEERRNRITNRIVITEGDRRLKYPGGELLTFHS